MSQYDNHIPGSGFGRKIRSNIEKVCSGIPDKLNKENEY
jgi:hypothetical protein